MKRRLLFVICFLFFCVLYAEGAWAKLPGTYHCVSNATELQAALTAAQSNVDFDVIQVVQGTYTGNFTFSSTEAKSACISSSIPCSNSLYLSS